MAEPSKKNKQKVSTEESKPDAEAVPLFVESRWVYREESRRLDAADVVILDESHKKVIKATWPLMSTSLEENGVRLYMKIFEVSPGIQAVFHLEKLEAHELEKSEVLRAHAQRFMLAVECAVRHLDDLAAAVSPIFINLGKHHVHFRGISDEYFAVFSGAMMYVWRHSLGDEFTPDVRTAWSRLFDFLLQHLKFGFNLACKDNAS